MSGLSHRVKQEMVKAAKEKNKARLSALRMIRAAIQNREIEKRGELTDAEVVDVLSSLVKKAKESIDQFRRGGREDLVDKEEADLEVALSFMPKQMDEGEVRESLREVIQEVGAEGPQDLGRVMKTAMGRLKGRAEGRLVQQIAREMLS
jgi:uncharacterized protein YqeY